VNSFLEIDGALINISEIVYLMVFQLEFASWGIKIALTNKEFLTLPCGSSEEHAKAFYQEIKTILGTRHLNNVKKLNGK
jgi:hypothetical protein